MNLTIEGRRSHHKVSVGELAEGSFTHSKFMFVPLNFTILIFSIFVDGFKMDDACLGSDNDEGGSEL